MTKTAVVTIALMLAACDSPIEPTPLPDHGTIAISPDPVPTLIAGMGVSMTAHTNGSVSVTWLSSDTSVAKVDAAGNVAAWRPGNAYIIAVAAQNSSVRDSVRITVTLANGESGTPTVFLGAIRDGSSGALVDSAAVRGFLDISAVLDAPSMMADGMVRILWNGEAICAEPMSGRGRFTHRCVFDTRRFANGDVEIRAQALRGGGVVFAISTARRLTLAN